MTQEEYMLLQPPPKTTRWARKRLRIFRRDGWTCGICGYVTPEKHRRIEWHAMKTPGVNNPVPRARRLTVDHIVPLRHGGTDGDLNLRPACHHCNQVRGSATEEAKRRIFG